MPNYVVGFLFTKDTRDVVLIEKVKPEWQKGKLNGVGGHIEEFDESNVAAMSREFLEETGVNILRSEWEEFGVLIGEDYSVALFRAFSDRAYHVQTTTSEKVYRVPSRHLPSNVVPNLRFLVEMALNTEMKYAELSYA